MDDLYVNISNESYHYLMLTPKRICDIFSSSIVDKHVLIKKNIFVIYIVVFMNFLSKWFT